MTMGGALADLERILISKKVLLLFFSFLPISLRLGLLISLHVKFLSPSIHF